VSLQYDLPYNTTIGIAYNNGGIGEQNQEFVQDIGNRTENFILGVKYKMKKLHAAFNYSINDDEILFVDDSTAVSFSTQGAELFLKYRVHNNWVLEGGFNIAGRTKSLDLYQDDYKLRLYIFGINYYLDPKTRIYLDTRISDSKGVSYKNSINVVTLGFRYNFDFNL